MRRRGSYLSFAPHIIDGSLPPSLIRPVYHVVVHQAGGVDHFGDHSDRPLPREQISGEDRQQDVRWDTSWIILHAIIYDPVVASSL